MGSRDACAMIATLREHARRGWTAANRTHLPVRSAGRWRTAAARVQPLCVRTGWRRPTWTREQRVDLRSAIQPRWRPARPHPTLPAMRPRSHVHVRDVRRTPPIRNSPPAPSGATPRCCPASTSPVQQSTSNTAGAWHYTVGITHCRAVSPHTHLLADATLALHAQDHQARSQAGVQQALHCNLVTLCARAIP
jgi:hypothetical protein